VASDRSVRRVRPEGTATLAGPGGWATAPTPVTSLKELGRVVQTCAACDLGQGRVKPVLGVGPGDARLLIVAATPRRHEDLQGVPLAGACRNVLDHALAAAGLSRDEVRITAVVRCRPVDDRTPTLDEIATCGAHLRAEIELVAPEVIVTLGAFATAILLGRPVPIERVAGYRLDVLQGTTLVPTYHPNDAVRGVPRAAPSLRRDLQVAKAVLDGRLTTGAQALAELRSRRAAGS
jgi:uracil-DNA glycosylase